MRIMVLVRSAEKEGKSTMIISAGTVLITLGCDMAKNNLTLLEKYCRDMIAATNEVNKRHVDLEDVASNTVSFYETGILSAPDVLDAVQLAEKRGEKRILESFNELMRFSPPELTQVLKKTVQKATESRTQKI
jgi:hypothetical protein